MLRFALPNLGQWTPRHAHLIGPDDLALPAEISLGGNMIEASKRVEGAASLAIQYPLPLPTGGTLTLRTTLLPERQAPYLLTLELARHQVMLLLNKLEEWALFDLPASDPVMQKVEQARSAWTHALVVQRRSGGTGLFSAEAESAALDALIAAVEAGESLALLSARQQHARRISGELDKLAKRPPPANAITEHEAQEARKRAAGSAGVILPETPKVGVGVCPAIFAQPICDAITACADFVSVPMRWAELEPTEGKYSFARTDRWIEWAVTKAKLPVTAGPVLDFDAGGVPDFLYIWEHDYETLRDVVIEHVKQVVTRYRRTVNTWTICSGLHVASNFAISYEQAVDLTRVCVLIVNKLHPSAKVQIEIAQPWGEYTAEVSARAARSIPPAVYCELLNQVGVEFDAVALKVQMGVPAAGRSTRDLIALSALLDRYGRLDKPIALSVLGAPASPATAQGEDAPEAGLWRRPWSPEQQAVWATRVMAIAAGKPYVKSICWQEIVDGPAPCMPNGGLLNAQGQPRPAMTAIKTLRDAMRSRTPNLPGAEP
ncbi:MAG: endo-1,4-beta-xylanase [Phycisphaerales bacterium]